MYRTLNHGQNSSAGNSWDWCERCSQDFRGGGGRDPPAKLNFYWSIFTGVCFVESSMFFCVFFWSEWVRIAQLVTAGTGVPRVDGSNPGGGRAQPKFV